MDNESAIMVLSIEIEDSSLITISHEGRKYRPVIRIRRKDPENIREFHRHFGGTLAQSKAGYWYWTVVNKRAIDLLRRIYPELHVKKPHADIIFELEASKAGGHRSRGARLPEAVAAQRADMIARMRVLNAGVAGKATPPGPVGVSRPLF